MTIYGGTDTRPEAVIEAERKQLERLLCCSEGATDMPIPKGPPARVIIESPYGSPDPAALALNREYLQQCIRHSTLVRNESPYASHQMLTSALDDNVPDERKAGIEAGFAWRRAADYTVVYLDMGLSKGMVYGIQDALKANRPIILRSFGDVAPEVMSKLEVLGLEVERAALPGA